MYSLGLTPTLQAEYDATLLTSHRVRTVVRVLDRNESLVRELIPQMISGSVTVNATSDVTRSLNAVFLDTDHAMAFDPASPSNSALYADNLLDVSYGVYLPTSQVWVDVPVFRGPITGFSRMGVEVTVEAQGKEALALDPNLVVSGYTIPKGLHIADAIYNVMNRTGEQRYQLTSLGGHVPINRTVIPGESPWCVVARVSKDANGHNIASLASRATDNPYLFYDGAGYLTAKNRTGNPVWTFTEDQLITRPSFKYDALAFRNCAVVTGGVAEGSMTIPRGGYALPPEHPLSPTSLGRHGTQRYMVIFDEVDTLKTNAECKARAKTLVTDAAHGEAEASFQCLPIPHLEELDAVTLQTGDYSITFKANQFTIPLTADAPMSVGPGKFVPTLSPLGRGR